jgi:hypothetical protein
MPLGFLGVNWDLSKGLGAFLDQSNGDIRYENGSYKGSQQERNDKARWANMGPSTPVSTPTKTPSYLDSAEYKESQRQIAALQQQIAAMPKLPVYNTSAAWSKAQGTASAAVNPVYQDKLNRQLAKYTAEREQQTVATNRGKESLDVSQRELMQDIGTERQRTNEDTASKIGEINYQEGQFQDAEGADYDVANREARAELSRTGLGTEAGLGAQQLEQNQIDRNTASADQVRTFTNAKEAQQLLKTRTFEDLDTKCTRSAQLTDVQKKDLDITLSNFIENQKLDEQSFRANNEAERLGAMFDATQQAYNTDIRNWLAGLSGQGWRSQDIALAYQTYQ